jgi:hypothetical protein
MLEATEGVLSMLGLKLQSLIAGAFGAFISLRFFEGLSTWEKWVTFVGGWAAASWLAEPTAAYLDLEHRSMETGLSLLIGMFGMSLAAAVIRVVRDTNWTDVVRGFIDRRGGGGGSSGGGQP